MSVIMGDGADRFLAYIDQGKLSHNKKAGIKVLYDLSENKRKYSKLASISHYFGLKLGKIIDVDINGQMYTLGRKSVEEFLKRNVAALKQKISFSDAEVSRHLQEFLNKKEVQQAGLDYQKNFPIQDLEKQELYQTFLQAKEIEVFNPAAAVIPRDEARALIEGAATLAVRPEDQEQLQQALQSQQAADKALRTISSPRSDGRLTISPPPASQATLGSVLSDPARVDGLALQAVMTTVSAPTEQLQQVTEMMGGLHLEDGTEATAQFKSETTGKSMQQLQSFIAAKYAQQRVHIEERAEAIQSQNSGVEPLEALKIAFFIETVICKVQHVADHVLHPEQSGLSRRLIISKNQVYVLDLKRGEHLGVGTFKTVEKAMRIFQNQRRNFEMVANAEMRITKKNASIARTEADIFKRLQGQPGIIPFYIAQEWTNTVDASELPESVTMISRLAEGSLTNKIKGLSDSERLQVAKDIVTGVVSAHTLNIALCDLKLDNVLFYHSDGALRAAHTDFGLAVLVDANGQGDKRFPGQYGSISETAPELLTTSKSKLFTGDCKKCDSWALGCMLYTLFVGENPPWNNLLGQLNIDKSMAKKKSVQRQIRAMAPPEGELPLPRNMPSKVQEAIRGLLHSDPGKRYSAEKALRLLG